MTLCKSVKSILLMTNAIRSQFFFNANGFKLVSTLPLILTNPTLESSTQFSDRYDIPDTFPSCIMEVSDAEVQGKWLTASDFKIGKTLTISNRRFLIYECDEFTRQWYRTEMNFEQPEKIEIPVESNSKKVSTTPFYAIFGQKSLFLLIDFRSKLYLISNQSHFDIFRHEK